MNTHDQQVIIMLTQSNKWMCHNSFNIINIIFIIFNFIKIKYHSLKTFIYFDIFFKQTGQLILFWEHSKQQFKWKHGSKSILALLYLQI